MKTNQAALFWLPELSGNQSYRDYPIDEESLILAMVDVIWASTYDSSIFHCHNCLTIGLCLEGNGVILIQGKEDLPFESGSIVIIPKGVRHSQQNMEQPSARWRYIAVNEDLLTQDAPPRCRIEIGKLLLRAKSSGIILLEPSTTMEIVHLIQHMFEIKCSSANEALAELEVSVLLILSRIARDQVINAALSDNTFSSTLVIDPALLLVARAYQQDIKVVHMARACALSESHFRKVFAQLTGVTPLEYLNRYRVKRAMHLLQTTTAPISRIAEECGYPTVTTFNRNFQRYSGISPSQWRIKNVNHDRGDH